ncbi:tyrosine-type recombinase/integrase [Gemmata sp.]|uniref:tyrosine-type recombinase/integrase n=1 Tax=Gemmata sp. TaxID=1914242 RepID=UPI003F6F6115
MPRPKNPVPAYRFHKQSGQAIVTVNLGDRRKDYLLGPYDSPESKVEYRRVLDDLAAGRLDRAAPADLTVNELCLRYWKHAGEHYRNPDGSPTSEVDCVRYAVRVLREEAGEVHARLFGPVLLKQVREAMVRKGWARPTVNEACNRVKRVFRWAVENELVPADRWEALRSVPGLQKGRTNAPEPDPVGPVDRGRVAATLPFVRSPVRGMIEVQLLTGMRPQDVVRVRPRDLDASGPVWLYRPPLHKNAYRGKARVVAIGPKAQAVLKEFAPADPDAHYFSPRSAVESLRAERAAARKTPRWASHLRRNELKRKAEPLRPPGEGYTTHGYAVAVARGCELAYPPPAHLARRDGESRKEWKLRLTPAQKAELKAWRDAHHWHPNQLRHTHGTEVRKRYGLEAAQVVLGHESADVTQVYAERDAALAARVAAEIG